MLPRHQRLRESSDFAAALRRRGGGVRAACGAVVVHLRCGPAAERTEVASGGRPEVARGGLVVSRAVGPAVVRNRVKRRLRHLLRARLAFLPPATDVVVRATPDAARVSFGELEHDLDDAMSVALRRLSLSGTGHRRVQ